MSFDMNQLPLSYMPCGRHQNATVASNGMRISIINISGRWYGMNYRSCDPTMMKNRDERATWARFIGVTSKEVETYVRRKKREKAKEQFEQQVEHAKHVLRHAGWEVSE